MARFRGALMWAGNMHVSRKLCFQRGRKDTTRFLFLPGGSHLASFLYFSFVFFFPSAFCLAWYDGPRK